MRKLRVIKFRGREPNGRWRYGDLFHPGGEARNTHIMEYNRLGVEYAVQPETVGQYIGLTDSNDKEIYDGDIVRVVCYGEESIHVITYNAERWDYPAFDLTPDLSDDTNSLSYCMCDSDTEIFVIGNIHDNPDMLTQKILSALDV